MTYVITSGCIGELDGACVKVCPVDCIYLGSAARYINPDECIDCGACEQACPVQAVFYEDDVPEDEAAHVTDNAGFFCDILPGRSAPLGNPGGARNLGDVGVDTPLVQTEAGQLQ
ncbi:MULTISPECIES: ferredoxin [Paracoccus]|uniref:ferredoxin n=1 Tax=Paracoccus TaxID=265 RepID=UPI00048D02CB|nr:MULTISPECIES: ferredoxin [Paracoccus]